MRPFDHAWQVLKEDSSFDLIDALMQNHQENLAQKRKRAIEILHLRRKHGDLEALVGHLPPEQQVQESNRLIESMRAEMAQREQQRAQEQERINALSPAQQAQQALIARQKELGYIDEFGNPLQ